MGSNLTALLLPLALALAALAAVQLARCAGDDAAARRVWNELLATSAAPPGRYDPAMVAELPEPARRFFGFAIAPGTPLLVVADIRMEGDLTLGSKDDPRRLPMQAQQVLAAPHGLVWRMAAGRGAMRVWGSDGMSGTRSWTRFWLWRLVPVVRAGDDGDHLRASFGRVVAEAAFWTPAALLPGPGVTWSAVDADTARATVRHRGLVQDVDIRVAADGQPVWVCIPRWTDANADKTFRVQPFGGELSDFRVVSGYRVPHRVEGGNFFGTPDYAPFYRSRVTAMTLR